MIRIVRPTLSAAELADYTNRFRTHVTDDAPDLLDVIFGGRS